MYNDEFATVICMSGKLGLLVGICVGSYYIILNNAQNSIHFLVYLVAAIIPCTLGFAIIGLLLFAILVDPLQRYFAKSR